MEYVEPNDYQEQLLKSLRSNFSFSIGQVRAVELLSRIPAKDPSFKMLEQWMVNGDIDKIRCFAVSKNEEWQSAISFYAIHFNKVIVVASVINVSGSEAPQVLAYKSLINEVAE